MGLSKLMDDDEVEVHQTHHGKWSEKGVPHRGWVCIDVEDLGEPSEIGQMCETMEIRYVHVMTHDDYPEVLRCGCVCAGNMEGDLVGAKKREGDLKKRLRFPSLRWNTSAKGNSYLKKNGVHVVVYKTRFGHFGYSIDEVRSSCFFATETEAMTAAFDQFDAKVKQAAANRRARRYGYYDDEESS